MDPVAAAHLHVVAVVSFLNEATHLPTFLASLAVQTQPPEQVLLVDDGSSDGSLELAQAFAASHEWATALARPKRPEEADRLITAPELRAFTWGLAQAQTPWDVAVKLDADLDLAPDLFARARRMFLDDPNLGLTGSALAVREGDATRLEPHPADHVRGPNKFYRHACYEQIAPLPEYLGWDTIDELRARGAGWRAYGFSPEPAAATVHLRPTGLHDGRLRAYRRWGQCAWGYGAHPLVVAASVAVRLRQRPYLLCGAYYGWGWMRSAIRREPRVELETRQVARREGLARLRRSMGGAR